MKIFKGKSIREKLLRMNLVSFGIVFLLMTAALVLEESGRFKRIIIDNLSTQARIIGNNSAAAISFNDQKAAEEILSSLKGIPYIAQAAIYSREGDIFAQYSREGARIAIPGIPGGYRYSFEGRYFFLSQPIVIAGDIIGAIHLTADLKQMYVDLIIDIGLLISVAAISIFIAHSLFSRLQAYITGPILEMADTMQAVSKNKDYSIRVSAGGEDEIGLLSKGFNEMLEQIQGSDEKLKIQFAKVSRGKKEWESTFDGIDAPIFLHDREFRILRANRAYVEMAGMSFQEIVGRPYYEVFPKMEGPFKICSEKTEADRETPPSTEDVYLPSIDRIFMMRSYTINDLNGDYLYSIHIFNDITEIKKAEEKIRHEMDITTSLLTVAEATGRTTDIDKLMEDVTHATNTIMGGDISISYLYEKEARAFRPSQCWGLSRETVPIFKTELLDEKLEFVAMALGNGMPLVVRLDDSRENQPFFIASPLTEKETKPLSTRPLSWIKDINTIVAIPLIRKSGYLGFLISIYTKQREFTERDRRIIEGIAQEASLALEVAYAYRASMDRALDLSHKVETIQVMNEIDRSILSTLDSGEILDIVVRLVSRLIPCDMAAVFLADRERGGFLFQAGFGTDLSKDSFIPFPDTSITEVVNTGRSQYTGNISEERPLLPLEKRFLEPGILSHIRVPLVLKGDTVGVLTVGAKKPAFFTSEFLSTLEKVAYQIGVAMENSRLVTDLQELFLGTVKSLASVIDAKSPWTAGHSERVTMYAVTIGKEMGLPEKKLKDLELAGLLHDIGKIETYDAILNKPGRPTDEEYMMIKRHPAKGAELLNPIKQLKDIIPWVKYHHEWYNGKGYPDGLKGEEIPLMARILTIADSFDAMTSNRPYRDGLSRERAIEEVRKCSGTQFDPEIAKVFLKILEDSKV